MNHDLSRMIIISIKHNSENAVFDINTEIGLIQNKKAGKNVKTKNKRGKQTLLPW